MGEALPENTPNLQVSAVAGGVVLSLLSLFAIKPIKIYFKKHGTNNIATKPTKPVK
jgi:hypothetical protein